MRLSDTLHQARPRDGNMLKSKFALLVAFGALVLGGNARADVVGLNTTTSTTVLSQAYNDADNFLTVNFTTTGNSTNKFTGVKFTDLGIGSLTVTARLSKIGTGVVATDTISYTAANTFIGFTNIANTTWDASSTYQLRFDVNQLAGATFANYKASSDGAVTNGISDWINTASQAAVVGSPGAAFTLYTAVPEPGTLILTGSALAAGAVGAYFKRRRKARTEAESAA